MVRDRLAIVGRDGKCSARNKLVRLRYLKCKEYDVTGERVNKGRSPVTPHVTVQYRSEEKRNKREENGDPNIYINRCVFKKSVRVEGGPVCRDAHGNILQDAVSGPEHTLSPYGPLESSPLLYTNESRLRRKHIKLLFSTRDVVDHEGAIKRNN